MTVHAAAYFREFHRPGAHEKHLRAINVDATLALLNRADTLGVGAFVYIGSAAAIGRRADGTPGDENSPPSALGRTHAYVASKLEASRTIAAYQRRSPIRVIEI